MYWAPLLFNRLTREVRFVIWQNQAQNLTSSPPHSSLLCSLQAATPCRCVLLLPFGQLHHKPSEHTRSVCACQLVLLALCELNSHSTQLSPVEQLNNEVSVCFCLCWLAPCCVQANASSKELFHPLTTEATCTCMLVCVVAALCMCWEC